MTRAKKTTPKQAMAGQLASQRWPEVAKARTMVDCPLEFRAYVDRVATDEGIAALKEIYGPESKPEPHGFHIEPGLRATYTALKNRIVQRILDEANYHGRRAWWIVEYTAEEYALMPKEEKDTKQTAEKEDARKHEYVETVKHGEFRKDSVLHIIYECLAKKGGSTKAEIHEALCKQFKDAPERHEGFKTTINCQIDRMGGERGFELARTAEGKYGIEGESGLKGWDSTRVLTAEQLKKRAEKAKAKESADAEKAKAKAEKEALKAKAKEAEDKKKAEAKAKEDATKKVEAEKQAKEKAKRDALAAKAKA